MKTARIRQKNAPANSQQPTANSISPLKKSCQLSKNIHFFAAPQNKKLFSQRSNNMKHILFVTLSFAIALTALSLTGCDNDGNNTGGNGNGNGGNETGGNGNGGNETGGNGNGNGGNETGGNGNGTGGNGGNETGGNGNGNGGNETGGNGNGDNGNENGNENGGNGDGGNETQSDLNVDFPEMSAVDNFIDAKILVLTKLAEQSETLQEKCQFGESSNDFVNYLNSIQNYISSEFRNNTNIANIKSRVSTYLDELIPTVAGQFTTNGVTPAHLLELISAFRTAHTIAQRKLSKVVSQDDAETALFTQLAGLGITATDIDGAITELRTVLESSILRDYREYAPNIVQQWEDCAQLDGWVQDLQQLGIGMSVPERPQQSRASVQAAN